MRTIHFSVYIVAFIGLVLSVSAYHYTKKLEDRSAVEGQKRATELATLALLDQIDLGINILFNIKGYFRASITVDRHEFRTFVSDSINHYPSAQAFEWTPRVRADERPAFERKTRDEGIADFRITEQSADGTMVDAGEREEYFPVHFLEPLAGNEAAMGYDLGSSPAREASLELARDSGRVQASSAIKIVQETGDQKGFLVFVPVYTGIPQTWSARREQLRGFVLGVFRIGDLFNVAVAHLDEELRQLEISVSDITDAGRPDLIHRQQATKGLGCVAGRQWRAGRQLDVAGRTWVINTCATSAFIADHEDALPVVTLVGGIALTLFAGTFLNGIFQRQRQIREQVQQKTAELLASEIKNKVILETAVNAVITIDPKGAISLFNPAAERLFGYSAEEMIGKNVNRLMPEPYHSEHDGYLQRYQRTGEARIIGYGREVVGERKDGSTFPLALSVGEARLPDETLFVGVLTDITEHKQAEQAMKQAKEVAEEASRAKSDFLANTSHEIRTPMNAIMGFSHLAMQTELTPRGHHYVEKIHASAHALLNVINDILDFSKIEAGKLEIEHIPFSLDEVFENVASLTVMKAEEKALEMLFDRVTGVPDGLVGDPLRLGQVLTNLVGNAIKFTERGEVTVSVHQGERDEKGVRLRFTVEDTGVGIEQAHISRLFGAFTQLDGSTTRRHGGSGLGLSICRHLVQLMDGELEVESTPGKGSIFSFSLPFAVQDTSEERHRIPKSDLRGLRALVVDDNPSARQILADMLASFTFEVTSAASAEEALHLLEQADKVQERPFRLVLMDGHMPKLNGVEAGRRIKQESPLSHIPAVILITRYGREEVMRQSDEAGMDGFLVKPISPSVLFDTVIHALGDGEHGTGALPRRVGPPIWRRLAGNVLLVEDNLINQEVAQELLERMGLLVRTAGNGREALDALHEHDFDLVLMDIQMPEMDGYEASRRIRAETKFEKLPVIALTAHAMAGEQEKCLAAGMNDHISKPIDPKILFNTLDRWLKPVKAPAPRGGLPSRGGAEVALPDSLPGIDLLWGLERVGGNRRLFRKLLGDFVTNHGDALRVLEERLASGDRDGAHRDVHTIQGVAGNIGARELQQAARKLETGLLEGRVEGAGDLPQQFREAFTILLSGLSRLDEADDLSPVLEVPHGDGVAPKADIDTLLRRLGELVEEGDPDAGTLLRQIEELLPDPSLRDTLGRLANQIETYDFDRARATLEILSGNLKDVKR